MENQKLDTIVCSLQLNLQKWKTENCWEKSFQIKKKEKVVRKNHHQLQMPNVKWKSGGQEQRQIKAKNQCSKKEKKWEKSPKRGAVKTNKHEKN